MIGLLLLLAAAPINHGWRCTSATSSGTDAVEYYRIGNELVWHASPEPPKIDFNFKIVHEDVVGLIAIEVTSGAHKILPIDIENWISADMLIINKKTGAFSRSFISSPVQKLGQDTESGYCIRI